MSGSPRSPIPFIVGAPRSGTTLLRLMLDAHPDLAIPPETGFLALCQGWRSKPPATASEFAHQIARFPPDAPTWPDFGLREDDVAAAAKTETPFDVANGVRAFYQAYAARFGKTRGGDKTPMYCFHIDAIHQCLPEARFIHLVRDGRDVAISWRRTWFSPGPRMTDLAAGWVSHVNAVREAARSPQLPVLEVRFEALVTTPARVLETICQFIDLPFHPAMLEHHRGAAARLREHGPRVSADGVLLVTAERRRAQQARTAEPVSNAGIGAWRRELSGVEVREFESVAGQLLDDLDYERSAAFTGTAAKRSS